MTTQKLWGGETDKAVANFPVSGEPIPAAVAHWLGRIKAAAARVNADLGLLDSELLRYLAEIAIVPGQTLELTLSAPFGGPLTVRTDSGEHAIARDLAASVGIA